LTLKNPRFFVWNAIQYIGMMVSGVKTLQPLNVFGESTTLWRQRYPFVIGNESDHQRGQYMAVVVNFDLLFQSPKVIRLRIIHRIESMKTRRLKFY